MVFFTCGGCGDNIKKPSVQKHQTFCRNSNTMSCMDCNMDFYGGEFMSHTKCITELEKYSEAGFKDKTPKGDKKQELWVDIVRKTFERKTRVAPAEKNLLKLLVNHYNIPRKKAKFMNFIRNISKYAFDNATIDSVWGFCEETWEMNRIPLLKAERLKEEEKAKGLNGAAAPAPAGETNGAAEKEDDKTNSVEDNANIPESESQLAIDNETAAATEMEDKPKKKKKKKNKSLESEAAGENGSSQSLIPEPEMNGDENENGEVKQKKKKKKDKLANGTNGAAAELEEPETQIPVEVKEKKKKHKKDKEAVVEEETEPAELESPAPATTEGKKKKKRKDKVVDMDNVEDSVTTTSFVEEEMEAETPKKKKKKRKSEDEVDVDETLKKIKYDL